MISCIILGSLYSWWIDIYLFVSSSFSWSLVTYIAELYIFCYIDGIEIHEIYWKFKSMKGVIIIIIWIIFLTISENKMPLSIIYLWYLTTFNISIVHNMQNVIIDKWIYIYQSITVRSLEEGLIRSLIIWPFILSKLGFWIGLCPDQESLLTSLLVFIFASPCFDWAILESSSEREA